MLVHFPCHLTSPLTGSIGNPIDGIPIPIDGTSSLTGSIGNIKCCFGLYTIVEVKSALNWLWGSTGVVIAAGDYVRGDSVRVTSIGYDD